MLDQRLLDLASWRIYDLAQAVYPGMPVWPSHVSYHQSLYRRHGDVVRPDGLSAASDLIIMSGHTGTHIDAPCHISRNGQMFGGALVDQEQGTNGFRSLGVETIAPVLGRGVLVDAPRLLGVEALEPGYEITPDLLEAAGVEIGAGDSVLIRTGWARYWDDPPRYISREQGSPGPGSAAARWLAQRNVGLCGSDSLPFECIRPGQTELPVHGELLVEAGVPIVEALNLEALAADGHVEFLLLISPLKLRGATGSPIRPLALVS
jgi:kynurenine formamidase